MIHGYWLAQMGIAGAYELVDRTPEAFADFFTDLAANGYVGGNITVPHKEAAYRLVNRRDHVAEAVGAVNTVWFEGATLMGSNSDPHGFIANLDDTTAHGIHITAQRDGRFVVTNARNGQSKTYQPRRALAARP